MMMGDSQPNGSYNLAVAELGLPLVSIVTAGRSLLKHMMSRFDFQIIPTAFI